MTNKIVQFSDLESYLELIRRYIDEEINPDMFEKEYLEMFKNDTRIWPNDEFDVLNSIFTDLDTYCNNPSIRDDDDLDENQLKERTTKNFKKLKTIVVKTNL